MFTVWLVPKSLRLMSSRKMSASRITWLALVLVVTPVLGADQLPPLAPLRGLHTADARSALICEAGPAIGNGGAAVEGQNNQPLRQSQPLHIVFEKIVRADLDFNQHLTPGELRTIDYHTRRQLLQLMDLNRDHQLSADELEQDLPADAFLNEPTPSVSEDDSYPQNSMPSQPVKFRNLRRFGIGLEKASPSPRPQAFAKAATFGTTPNFRPPTKKVPLGQRSPVAFTLRSTAVTAGTIFVPVGGCE